MQACLHSPTSDRCSIPYLAYIQVPTGPTMSSSLPVPPLWVSGNPEQLATQFTTKMGKFRGEVGRKSYVAFVTAAACASVHQVLQSTAGATTIAQQLNNILHTAKAIADKAAASEPDLDDDEMDEEDDEYENDPAATSDGQPWAMPLRVLTKVVKQAEQKLKQTPGTAPTGKRAAAASSGGADANNLPFPTALLQAVIDRLDSRSAAAAAAACKSLRAAYTASRCFEVSEALQAYVQAVIMATQGSEYAELSDGSCEAAFNLQWPLDGSTVAGMDIEGDSRLRMMSQLLPTLGPLLAMLGEGVGLTPAAFMNTAREKFTDATRPPPDANSTPLAIFKKSKPVNWHTSTSSSSSTPRPTPSAASANTPAAATAEQVAAACCDIWTVGGLTFGCPMHLDGDLLSVSYQHGWKLRDPGLAATDLSVGFDGIQDVHYSHGFFNDVSQVCSDSRNALVWAAADDGKRIKAFRAPKGIEPANMDAACNRSDNGLSVQYTLSTDVKGLSGGHAGLFVLGTKVIAANSGGTLLTWDISDLPAQTSERTSAAALGGDDNCSDDGNDDDDDDDERFKGSIGWRDTEDPTELEVSCGVAPQAMYKLQKVASCPWLQLDHMALLTDTGDMRSPSHTLLAAYGGFGGDILLAYDVETQKVKNQFLGHVFSIECISPAPASWAGAQHLFATCSRGGDVKIWDLRGKTASAAVTLARGGTEPLTACVLAATNGGSTASSSSDSGQLGSGMFCFAGGACEAVWCWDLRASKAEVLYEMSTGNNSVVGLAWHEKSSTLLSSCESMATNRFGDCYRDDFIKLGANGDVPVGSDDEDNEMADDDDGEERWWPQAAKHSGNDFKKYFSMPRSCMIAYHFGPEVSREVPHSEQPSWSGEW